jgi:hypothetical protein
MCGLTGHSILLMCEVLCNLVPNRASRFQRSCRPAYALVALYLCVAIVFMKTILVHYKMLYNVGWSL